VIISLDYNQRGTVAMSHAIFFPWSRLEACITVLSSHPLQFTSSGNYFKNLFCVANPSCSDGLVELNGFCKVNYWDYYSGINGKDTLVAPFKSMTDFDAF
jgi:hypothetical protein